MPNPYPANVQEHLARERNHLAADRSLLSFVRSSLTLISVGVAIDQGGKALGNASLDPWIYGLSLVFVGLGGVTLLLATLDYRRELQRLQAPEYCFCPRPTLGGATGWVVLTTGLVAFVWLAAKAWP